MISRHVAKTTGYPRVMRKPNPENIFLARRAARFRRLVDEHHLDELDAEHWLSGWEREAESRGLERYCSTFWSSGEQWIAEQRQRR